MSPPGPEDSHTRASALPCSRDPAVSPGSPRLVFQMPAPQQPPQKQKSRRAISAGGAFPAFNIAYLLGRAPRARLVAVMMMVSMRPKTHLLKKLQESNGECQSEDYLGTIQKTDASRGFWIPAGPPRCNSWSSANAAQLRSD